MNGNGKIKLQTIGLLTGILLCWSLLATSAFSQKQDDKQFPNGDGKQEVEENCTTCHTAKLILQQRMSRKRWDETITWMQEKQGLWNLQPSLRKKILDYLSLHFGPQNPSPADIVPSENSSNSHPIYEFHYPPNPL